MGDDAFVISAHPDDAQSQIVNFGIPMAEFQNLQANSKHSCT